MVTMLNVKYLFPLKSNLLQVSKMTQQVKALEAWRAKLIPGTYIKVEEENCPF